MHVYITHIDIIYKNAHINIQAQKYLGTNMRRTYSMKMNLLPKALKVGNKMFFIHSKS